MLAILYSILWYIRHAIFHIHQIYILNNGYHVIYTIITLSFMLAAMSPKRIHAQTAQCHLNVGQRRRQWTDIRPKKDLPTNCWVNDGLSWIVEPAQCFDKKTWVNVGPPSVPALGIHRYIMQVYCSCGTCLA